MSKLFKNRKLILISLFSLIILIVSTISFIALINSNNNTKDPKFVYNSGHYITDQEAISTSTLSSNYTKMNTLYTANGLVITASGASIDSNKTIAIESELDFFAFTMLAKASDSYLTYKYELLCNLDMSTITDPVYPIGYNGKEFSGTFNGNGHIIKNLYLVPVSTSNASTFNSTNYYALFRKNTGTIANFGLVNPKINVAITPASVETANGIYYVSNVVGWNAGTVSYVFVRDNIGTEAKRTPGIEVLESGFHIAGLVGKNTGTFNNSYYASSTLISSTSGRPAEMQEILVNGTATDNTLFFYNSLIDTYTSTAVRYGGFIDRTYNYTTHYGTYEATLPALNTAVVSTTATGSHDNTWYMGDTYENIGDLSTFFDTVITPVTRGFKTNQVRYDVNDDKKYHVEINNANDLSYIYELMDTNSKFASNAFVYELDPKGDDNITRVAGINLDNVLSPKYQNGIAAEFRTKEEYITAKSTYATLYLNAFSYKVTTLGIDAYGVFPYLTGTVRYLNFVVGGSTQLEFTNSSTNITAYGAIAGYAEGATIDHCNVYNNFKITNKVGKYFVGGAVGILAGEGEIKNSTANGTIASLNTNPKSFTNPDDYPDGVIIGGVVGYIDSSLGSVDTLYNETTITAQGYTGQEFVAGGVIGAGYTSNADELQNNGSITISNSNYSKLYVSGVIGRLLGVSSQITLFTNNGDINVTQIDAPTYVSGVLNADIQTDDTIAASLFKQKSNFYFYAAALTNGANVTLTGTKTNTYMYTDVINVLNNNGFITKLSGIYNLNYKFASKTTALNAQSISVNLVDKFAPVVMSNADLEHSASTIDLTTSYNLRDITLTQSSTVSYSINYAGCAYGSYITYADVRNEGNITFNPSYAITGNITISGVFNELSSNSTASSIYNGGDIKINYTAIITGNINVAGICYANRNGITDIDSYNPTSTNYDSKLLGSLNDCINNGEIKVSSSSFSNIGYGNYWYRHTNGLTVTVNIVYTTYDDANPRVIGNINTAGIVNINESVITNTFNLSNVKALNYITETAVENRRQINAGGISTLNIGKYAYIINSANNGDITAANLASYAYTPTSGTATNDFGNDVSKPGMISATTPYYSDVTVGGIVSRNDKTEDGSTYSSNTTSPNSSQVISFTINYGAIYAYNYGENNSSPSTSTSTKGAAIIGAGLCNVINVNNYGAVYSGDVSAGIFGLISLSNYAAEVDTNKIYIANTLNYGNIYSLKHSYDDLNSATGIDNPNSGDIASPKYSNFNNDTLAQFGFISYRENNTYRYYAGSIIGIIDYNSRKSAATNIVIRYLVSFYDALSISGAEMNVNSEVTPNTDTIYSPYLQADVDGKKNRDDYLATNVQYAPLSSSEVTNKFLLTNASSGGYETMTFYGVFNKEFTFRRVIEGEYEDGSKYFNTATYKTDRFLTDFFQFIPYSYVNENLMEKIGWRTSAYLDAANKFANSLEGTYLFYKSDLGTSTYSDDLTAALSTSTWSQYADPEILTQLVEKLISSSDKAGILAYIEYIFSDTNTNSSIFTSTLRGTIVEYVYKNYKSLIDTSELLKFANGYSTILTNALCSDEDNEVKQDIITYISDYINELGGVTKEELLLSYIDYLDSYGSSFFTTTSTQSKYELLQNLFSEITDPTFYKTLIDLFSTENKTKIEDLEDYSLSGYGAFIKLSAADKIDFFKEIVKSTVNSYSNLYTYLNSFAGEISLFDYLRNDGYDKQSLTDVNNSIASTSTSNTNEDVINERVALWNQIKETTIFKNWFNGLNIGTKYYLATEVNNTYQTDSAPIPYGNASIEMVKAENPNELGVTSDLNFVYTTEVTPNTYFYGPYAYPTTGYLKTSTVNVYDDNYYYYYYDGTYYSTDGGKTYVEINSYYATIPVGATCYCLYNNKYYTINYKLNGTYYTKNGNNYQASTTYNSSSTYYTYVSDRNSFIPNGDGTTLSTTAQGTVQVNRNTISKTFTTSENSEVYSNRFYAVFISNGALTDEQKEKITSIATGVKGRVNNTNNIVSATNPLVVYRRTETESIDDAPLSSTQYRDDLTYQTVRTGDYIIDSKGNKQTLGYVYLNRPKKDKTTFKLGDLTVDCTNGVKYNVYSADDPDNPLAENQTNWDYILKHYVYNLTINTVTDGNSGWHSTGRTGIYVKLTYVNNQNTGVKQRRYDYDNMFTTRYIDYDSTKLLDLDGYLTKYSDGTTPSADERDIINDIFNTILLTNSNKDNFLKVVAASLFESLGTTNTTNHINFINNFVGNGVTTSNTVGGTVPFTYLKYSTSQTILQYLSSLSLDNEFKKKLLNAASKDKDVFVELIELLFNKSLIVGADTTYDPGHSLNYGGNFDVDLLNSRLELIAYNKYSTTPSSSLPNVIPGKNLTNDSSTGITYSGSETQSQYTVLATGEKIPLTVDPNSITSTNYLGANATEAVSSQNIGYYLGNQNKINQKTINYGNALIAPTDTINGDYTDSSGKTPSESKKTPRQLFIVTGANGNYQGNTIRPLTDTEFSALPEGIQNLVPNTNTSVTHSMIRLSQRYPGSINFTNTTQNDAWAYHGAISYFGKTYGSTENGIALPNNGIWFKPQKTGKIRMVFYTGSDGKSFCLTKVNRTSATTANPFAGTAFTASTVDLTGRNNLPKYLLVYYEYEVTDEDLTNNVEFWLLGGDDSEDHGAYFLYLDMGINGGGPKTEDIAYYEQNTLNNTTNYNDNVYKLISYLTPLNAGNNVISYIPATDVTSSNVTDYYTYSTATTYNEGTTYYSRDGSGHYVIAHGVTSENVTNYYLFSQATTYDSETTYYVQHKILEYQNQVFCDRFMKILSSSSNAATYALIKSLDDKDAYEGMLKYLATLDSRNFDSIIAYANANHLFPAEFEYYLTGGWLATDYYRKYKTDITTTYIHDRLEGTSYQYLTDAQSINIETFIEFCKHIDYPLDMNYGIYALASNEGIKNGVFIPDNLNLDKMDPEYTTDSNVNFKLIETNTTLESNSTDAKWRGGTGTDEGEDDVSGYTGNNVTVNQAFYIEMKQLKKSISTTVFELTLKKGDNLYYGDVDLDNHTVTYYVTELSTGDYTVDTIDLAYGATAYENAVTTTTGSTEFKKNSTVNVTDAGEVMQFTVFAEDTNVYKTYKIIFKVLVTDLTMEYDTEKTKTETTTASASSFTVPSSQSDTTVYLNITSKDDKLPKGFDLKPYLSLTDGTNTYKMDDETGYVTISTISTDHKIKEDGNAVATLTISYKLPAGTYNIELSLCGETVSVEYIKQASSACAITNMKFNGSTVTFDSNNKATSNILFGRAYNNIELIDIDGTYSEYYNFYLDNLEVSANATVTSTATKTLEEKTYYFDADNEITYNITSYEITYTVTAEDGTFAKYYHTLTEYDPYDKTNNPKYGDIFKDGTTDDVANTAFDETVTNGTKNQTVVSFERGNEAYYRIKYDFSKIYTLGNNVVYSKEETTDSSLAGVATFNLEYRGISADVNEYCDAGTYTFLYKYKNTQEWDITIADGVVTVGETTYIQYTFPRLVINKTYSTDATLHSIILIDAYKEVGKASTVMDINNLRPTDSDLKTNESYYQTLITATNNNIEVGEPINYSHAGTDYSAYTYTDYYTVGTVSNALLTNYAPTFEIESHAMIFQSTTLAKLKTYGFDKNQTATDAAILGDHISNDGKILFIYVPFTYTSNGKTLTKNFLVKMNGKTLTEVYEDTYTGLNTETSVATLTNVTLDTIRTLKLDAEATMPSFTAGGVTYTLSNIAGNQTNNSSLNMDYIGNPLDDHFWYVSYVVFSEDYIRSSSNTHIKFYHTALIDISNNVYFTIKVVTPNDATFTTINNIYVTVLGYTKNKTTNEFEEVVVGTYVNKKVVDTTANTITYELIYSIQILPSAYYYFYIDLPGGYVATSKITDPAKVFIPGTSSDYLENIANYEGAYLPPSSIVVQRVPVTITVSTGTSDNSSWAIATSDIYTRLATLTQD